MLFIKIGFPVAHIALVAAIFTLRDSEHLWVLGLMFAWYCLAMLGSIAAIRLHYKRSTQRGEPLP
ncbi:hypothetical protein E0H51_22795 [Rhizobium leguminosarum bv. viciae]|uniref:Uncharacterized protein n=1 Tax=Rhizobium leguminosarum TaxID=384 RepID=A0ABD7PJU2_RHILE|nr:hypothetical protein CHY08_22205 [Rhizobium leguminosarum bv. viciae]TAV66417.1 hypothetical protein ELI28_24205 [Rhizobium leguminosarum]TAV66897.1 hypothetical protein ELI27_25195 [Rhizobium leguminosarum]TAW24857.1 hypothetical protein ELI19_25410 [Rhizobium leguminosarum]TAW38629.1 hypothetical protein ELI18_25380 [Rhizobium leguminosarum]